MQLFQEVYDKILEHWFPAIGGLLSGLFLWRLKLAKNETDSIKMRISTLEHQQIAFQNSLDNFESGQKEMKKVQTEIRTDIKQLLRQGAVKKGWW